MSDLKNGNKRKGFASMDPQKQKEIASKGGKVAHKLGKAHEFTSEEARAAGRKGGLAQGKHNNPANFANNPQKASEAGRKGGQSNPNQPKGSSF